jgi:hypothetical protein
MEIYMNDDFLTEMREGFKRSQDAWSNNQERYESDVRFARKGEQWGEADKKLRDDQGRPMLTINKLASFIRQVVNDARMNKPQIKVFPNDNEGDPETAEVLNGIIRNIEQISKADLAYDTAIDCATSGGFGFFRIDLDYVTDMAFDMEIGISRILNPLTVYPDANSIEADSADWNECYVTEMIPNEEFEARYPDAELVSFDSGTKDVYSGWYEKDATRIAEFWKRTEVPMMIYELSNGDIVDEDVYETMKDDYDTVRVTIVQSRKSKKHQVKQYIVSGAEILEEFDWPGKYIPIVPVYGDEVFVDGERHLFSLIHFAKDPQRMYNYWRTASTELVALAPKAPWIGPAGAFNSDPGWATANREAHQYLEYDGDIPPQRQPFAGPPAGALQESLNSSDDMKSVMGMHDASMGAQSNEISGVAIHKRVSEGDTSNFHFIDNTARAIRHAGNIIVDLIPKVYSRDRMIRILGEDGTAQTVRINAPVQKEEEGLQGEGVEKREATTNIYDLNLGKYDVTVKSGPSFTTQRVEARESMLALLQAWPQAAAITGDLVVESMDWPNADIFAKRLKSLLPPGIADGSEDPQVTKLREENGQMKEFINQILADREGKADANKVNMMNAETKRLEAGIKQQEANIKRMEAEIKAAAVNSPQLDAQLNVARMSYEAMQRDLDRQHELKMTAIQQYNGGQYNGV